MFAIVGCQRFHELLEDEVGLFDRSVVSLLFFFNGLSGGFSHHLAIKS